jgi:hypothetical protein
MPVIMDQRDSWFTGAMGAVLVAGAVFLGVVMFSLYGRMLGVCFEWLMALAIQHRDRKMLNWCFATVNTVRSVLD